MTDTETIIDKYGEEIRIYDEQFNLNRVKYGEETASKANYGWAVSNNESAIWVATKVYGIGADGGAGVLVSEWKPLHPISHHWEPYENAEQQAARLRRLYEEQKEQK